MNKKDIPQIDKAIEAMNKALSPKSNKEVVREVVAEPGQDPDKTRTREKIEPESSEKPLEEALIEPYSRRHTTGVKLIDDKMRAILLKLAEKYFFYDAISARAGIYRRRLNEELSRNKEFAVSFAYARHKFIARHQELLIKYAKDKREKDWRAIKYILTIADKEYSERKYLTDAVTNQDAKILMLIKAEQLTIAGKEAGKMLKDVKTVDITALQHEKMSLMPFDKKKVKESTKQGKKKKPSVPQSY